LPFADRITFVEEFYSSQEVRLQQLLDWAEQSWMPAGSPAPVEHGGITCDGCDARPLRGLRFKCNECSDFDLCADCFAKKDTLHLFDDCADHSFRCIPFDWAARWHQRHGAWSADAYVPWEQGAMKGAWAAKMAMKGLWCKGIGKGKGKCKGQKWDEQEDEEGEQTMPCEVKGKGKGKEEYTSRKWDIQEDEVGEASMPCEVKGKGKGKGKHKGKCKDKCQGLHRAVQELEEGEETVPYDVEGKGQTNGKGNGKCKGKACQPRECAAGCGFQVTWHTTHCCGACARGGRHGPRCEKKPVPPAPVETPPDDGMSGECMATGTEDFLLLSAADASDMEVSAHDI